MAHRTRNVTPLQVIPPIPPIPPFPNTRFGTALPTALATDNENDTYVRTSNGLSSGSVVSTFVFDKNTNLWVQQSGAEEIVDVTVTVMPTYPTTTIACATFSPNQPATAGITYAVSNGTLVSYAKWNGTQYISAAAPANPQDFFRSVTPVALPDGTTDTTEAIRRNGNIGLNTDPLSTLDVAGSYGVNYTESALATVAVDNITATLNLTLANTQTVTMPAVATATRRIIRLLNRTAFGKVTSPAYLALDGTTTTLLPINSEVTLQSNGTNWVEISNTRLPASTANFAQVLASGSIDLGDPTPIGARPFVNLFNVVSAAGLDGPITDSRFQVNFATPATSTNYVIVGSFVSKVAANWNNDNDILWTVVSKSVNGFVIAVREMVSIVQGVLFDFQCVTFQNAPATLALPEIAQFVALNTAVTLDNIRLEARLLGGQGFRIATVAGTALLNISAVTSFATASVFGSNIAGFTATTTMTHPFGWAGNSDADGMTGQIYDRTSNRMYDFTIMTNVAPTLSFIRIVRVL